MSVYIRQFVLDRVEDESGISGTGIVAEGVVFTDGTTVLRWKTKNRSTSVYASLAELKAIHGHGGKTRVVVCGDPFSRGFSDAGQDACENAPFASIGGLDKRSAMVAPKYIIAEERERYLDGYRAFARATYGADWATCSFGWAPALEIGGSNG